MRFFLSKFLRQSFFRHEAVSWFLSMAFIKASSHIKVRLIHYSPWTVQVMFPLTFDSRRGRNPAQGRYRHVPVDLRLIWSRFSCLSPLCLSALSSVSWPITAEVRLSLHSLSGYVMAVRGVKTGSDMRGKKAEQDSWNIHAVTLQKKWWFCFSLIGPKICILFTYHNTKLLCVPLRRDALLGAGL